MRFIPLENRRPKRRWLRWAKSVTRELERAVDKAARDKVIDQHQGVWKRLLPWLLKQSRGKCWFSEARDSYSYWHVEHFRPKKAMANPFGAACVGGYWWLAFDWKNLRVCGGVGNVRKGEFFPLRKDTHVATQSDRNIKDEHPYLLDPIREEDPILLTFDSDGSIAPLPDLDLWQKVRVEESIKRYRLQDYEPLRNGRRAVWAICALEVNKCQNLMAELSKYPSATTREQVRQQIQKLRTMVKFDAEFSSVACECLRSRKHMSWAHRLASEAQAN